MDEKEMKNKKVGFVVAVCGGMAALIAGNKVKSVMKDSNPDNKVGLGGQLIGTLASVAAFQGFCDACGWIGNKFGKKNGIVESEVTENIATEEVKVEEPEQLAE